MTHHEQDIALLQMVKGCTFGKNAPDKFVGDFTAAFLVRTLRIAIEDSASYLSKFSAFNGNWVGKFTASLPVDWSVLMHLRPHYAYLRS